MNLSYQTTKNLVPKYKIFHIADMQYEVRSNQQRWDEYMHHNDKIVAAVEKEQPDMIVIAGDIYEHEHTGGCNNTEQMLFFDLLSRILRVFKGIIIITTGNHDINQKSSTNQMVVNGGEIVPYKDGIELVTTSIGSDRVHYLKYTGCHTIQYQGEELQFVVHSQYNKHLKYLPEYIYTGDINENGFVVDLFHDPLSGYSLGFNRELNDDFAVLTREIFRGNSILAGDIHAPSISELGDNLHGHPRMFAYSSSSCMRNYGEGDYYVNGFKVQDGASQHGYMVWNVDQYGTACSIDFNPIKPLVNRVTVTCTKMFNNIALKIPSYVKIKSGLNHEDTATIKKRIQESPNCLEVSVEGLHKVNNEEVDDNTIESRTDFSKEELLKQAMSYVETVVESSRIPDKEKAKEQLQELVKEAFGNVMLNKPKKDIRLKHLQVENFLGLRQSSIKFIDLLRISGTNGAGKSTNPKALIWCLTGKITGDEKNNQKNKNLLEIKSRYTDENMFVRVVSNFNGDDITVSRCVEFSSKKPIETITIEVNGHEQNIPNPQDWLDERFPFEEVSAIYHTAVSLENNLKLKPETLRNIILRKVGVDAVNELSDGYKDTREKFLSSFPNPANKKEFYENKITKCQELVQGYNDSITKNLETIQSGNDEIAEDNQRADGIHEYIETLKEKVDDKVSKDYYATKGQIQTIEKNIQKSTEELENFEGGDGFDSTMLDNAKQQKDILEGNLQEVKDKIESNESALEELRTKKEELSKKGSERKELLSEQATEDFNKNMELHRDIINKLNEQKVAARKEQDVYESKKRELVAEKKRVEKEVISLKKSMSHYENAICANCGKPHEITEEDFEKLEQSILAKMKEEQQAEYAITNLPVVDNKELIASMDADISKAEQNIKELDLSAHKKRLISEDENIKEILGQFKKISDSIASVTEAINKLKSERYVLEKDLKNIEKTISEQEKLSNEWLASGDKKTMLYNHIAELKTSLEESKQALVGIEVAYNKQKEVAEKIQIKQIELRELENNIKGKKDRLHELAYDNRLYDSKIGEQERIITEQKTFIKQIEVRSMATKTMNLLKKIVSGDGLPLYIFNSIATIINQRIAEMTEDYPFSLEFVDGVLYKLDKRNGTNIHSPIKHVSGMEIALGGLVLDRAIDSLNDEWNIDGLFIDELSGALSDGDGIQERDAINYRKLYCDLLHNIAEVKNVTFVDHVLKGIGNQNIQFLMGKHGGYHIES